jgi:metal-dependent HD superfamily phosphatase/phosphodiesterase
LSHAFNIPFRENTKLRQVVEGVKEDVRLWTFWKCANVMAIDRMGYTDHGPTHVRIVANSALKLLRILIKRKVVPSVVKNYGMKNEDAEVIVVLGSIFHDLGMIVSRDGHEQISALLSVEFLEKHLKSIYTEEERAVITSEVLHAIVSHERQRKPFEAGKVDIHSVSALSIEKVDIQQGEEKPVTIRITMSNSAGIFQIDELLKPRIENSGLQDYIHVLAEITGEKERKIVEKFEI